MVYKKTSHWWRWRRSRWVLEWSHNWVPPHWEPSNSTQVPGKIQYSPYRLGHEKTSHSCRRELTTEHRAPGKIAVGVIRYTHLTTAGTDNLQWQIEFSLYHQYACSSIMSFRKWWAVQFVMLQFITAFIVRWNIVESFCAKYASRWVPRTINVPKLMDVILAVGSVRTKLKDGWVWCSSMKGALFCHNALPLNWVYYTNKRLTICLLR